MSSSSQSGKPDLAKLDLNARASELKQRLLESRGQSQSAARFSSSSPANDAARVTASAPTPSRRAQSNTSASELGKQPTMAHFVPHQIPQKPRQISLRADANDIAALISSISANTPTVSARTQDNGAAKQQAKQPVNPQLSWNKNPTTGSASSHMASPKSAAPPSQPRRPAPERPVLTLKVDGQPLAQDNKNHNQPKQSSSSTYQEGEAKADRPNRDGRSGYETPLPTPKQDTAFSTGDIRENRAPPDSAGTKSSAQVYKATAAGQHNSTNSNGARTADKITGGEKQVQKMPVATTNRISPPSEALERALELDKDLGDWLVLTDYYDVESRTRKLERHRKVKALAAEKLRIEKEEQELMQEEMLEMGIRRPTAGHRINTMPGAVQGHNSPNIPTPVTAEPVVTEPVATERTGAHFQEQAPAKPANTLNQKSQIIPAKRYYDEPGVNAHKEKQARMEEAPTRPKEVNDGFGGGDQRERDLRQDPRHEFRHENRNEPRKEYRNEPRNELRYEPRSAKFDRRPSPFRGHSPRRYNHPPPYRSRSRSRSRSPSNRPREYSPPRFSRPSGLRGRPDHGEFHDSYPKYDSYRGDGGQYPPSPRELRQRDSGQISPPSHIALGQKGDARYFIVKSFNEDNVLKCMDDGVWATQVQNGQVLTSAFANCRNVILFFSINKSKAFQGYARMATAPSPDTPRPKWMSGIHWDVSPPFRVEWLSKVPVEFFRVGHLKNRYNEYLPVLVGKDGQEIEEECGRQLLLEMEQFAEAKADVEAARRGAKKPIKREDSMER
ncbi:YT521-B-like domain-containing protein [Lasiosphaeria ovina]|uniref:YT521-B-like domain-containing protein n=1 Tax=Lasiosphaeria ovina TaxID=92902 RepID=A0AAE0NMR7_9PEZI|nr:YT521-B-like domain-containing protein [Lasiosphaeria ovina]